MRSYYAKRLFRGGEHLTLEDVLTADCEPEVLGLLKEWQDAFQKESISPLVVYEALDTVEDRLYIKRFQVD